MRRVGSRAVIAVLTIGVATLLVGLGDGRAQDAGEVRLGAFMPISGISADVGAQIKAGIEVAVERTQQPGLRISGKPHRVRVIWYDTEGKGDVGLNVVTRALTVDRIHVGVGFLSSDVFIRVMDEFQKAAIPVITCCSASLKIGDKIAQNKMGFVFQLSPTANDIARSLAAAVAATVKPQKIALLNENTDAGRDFSRITRDWFAANVKDVEVVADEFVDRGVTDLTPQLAKMKRVGAQAIIGEIYGASGPVLYTQWNELRVPAVIAHMGATVAAQDFVDRHAKLMDGTIVNNRWWPAKYSEVSEPMTAAYKKKTGVDATNFAVQGHDAALVAIEAIVKAQSLEPEKVRTGIEQGTFVTAWGTRKFTSLAEGHRMPIQTVVVQIQGGKKVPIYPPDVATTGGGKYVPAPPFAWEKK
ncbi:MAG TPA: ABC transporter substrate-binding protein [Methylomirabilota bacterium]|nr:ABC transporter substrate-binding protein [Methylomirabilota bacterium]